MEIGDITVGKIRGMSIYVVTAVLLLGTHAHMGKLTYVHAV